MREKDKDDMWLVLTSWGSSGFFESHGYLCAFQVRLVTEIAEADFDFVQLARDSFVLITCYGCSSRAVAKLDQFCLPGCVHCDASSLMTTESALLRDPCACTWWLC